MCADVAKLLILELTPYWTWTNLCTNLMKYCYKKNENLPDNFCVFKQLVNCGFHRCITCPYIWCHERDKLCQHTLVFHHSVSTRVYRSSIKWCQIIINTVMTIVIVSNINGQQPFLVVIALNFIIEKLQRLTTATISQGILHVLIKYFLMFPCCCTFISVTKIVITTFMIKTSMSVSRRLEAWKSGHQHQFA